MEFIQWMKVRRPRIPGWLFTGAVAFLCELFLHLWTAQEMIPGQLAAVSVFALGFGCLMGLVCSVFSHKAEKLAAIAISLLLIVLYMTEYFMIDAYKNYMSLQTMFSRAGDVTGDFMPSVINLLRNSAVRIMLVLLPLLVYGVLAKPGKTGWKTRFALLVLSVALYASGVGVVYLVGTDVDRFGQTYNFDSAVHSFGLNVGLALDVRQNSSGNMEAEFVEAPVLVAPTEAPVPAEPEKETEASEETEPPVVYEPHCFDLDFAALADAERYQTISSIHSYVASLEPTLENEYTGLFEGMNLIFVTAESFSTEAIDPERTPTLYRLANEGIRFTDYYQPAWGASTTSGEFSNLVGLMPVNGGDCMRETLNDDLFLTLGKQLQKRGYTTAGYHNHNFSYYDRKRTHVEPIGLQTFTGMGNGLEAGVQSRSPESDLEMIDFTIPKHLDGEPFYLYYITMSGHAPYTYENHAIGKKNYGAVEDLECSETIKIYYAANLELEYAMESMLRQLEEAGIADNTAIVLTTDHYPYALEKSAAWGSGGNALEELYGQKVTDCFIRDHSTLIIWSKALEEKDIVVEEPVFSLDLVPTLSNLFGLEYDSRLLVGRDVFSDELPLVFWPTYSWKTDKGSYNSNTRTFTPAEGVTVDEAYVEYVKSVVANKITFSKAVQKQNYYTLLLKLMNQENP